MKKTLVWTLALCFLIIAPLAGAYKTHKVTVPLRFDYYYTYEMVVEALEKLHKAYPALTKLEEVGKSEEGRTVYCMTVNNPNTGKALDKPGIYVDGNIHGNEIQAGEVALYLLDYLLREYKNNPEITRLVDKKCFYVIPVVNPDGRWHFFNDVNSPDSNRGLRRPKDDDRDGLFDEDFPDDLDKDGSIGEMRKKDPFGKWKTDPKDPRSMVRVKPGEKGEWTLLGEEGIDNDGDGRINEDSQGYVDGNRNWPYDWRPPYVQMGAGDYPLSGEALKAQAEFILSKTNICMGWTFHNFGGMFLRGPSTKAQGEFPPEDVAVFDYLGDQAERIVPDYRYMVGWKGLYETYGDFDGWLTTQIGAYAFTGELSVPKHVTFKSIKEKKEKEAQPEEGEEGGFDFEFNTNAERLKFNDHLTQGEQFKAWKPYKHPLYGDIEIGGWVKFSTRNQPPFMLMDTIHRNASAIIFSAKQTPEVSLKVTEIKKIADNQYRVRTKLENTRAMPTLSAHSRQKKLFPLDMLTLRGNQIRVNAGGKLIDKFNNKVNYKSHRPELQFLYVPGFGKVEHQFLVSGSGKVTIKYKSRHAGNLSKTIELK